MKNISIKFYILLLGIFTLFTLNNKTNVYAFEISESITVAPTLPTVEYNPIKSIKLNHKKINVNKGDNRYLKIFVKYKKKNNLKKEPYLWYTSNPKVATVNKNGVVTGLSKGTTYISFKALESNVEVKCKVVVKKTKYVAFTFDDGPGKYTNELLNVLDKYNSKATFFLLGEKVDNYEKAVKKAYNLGMEIGSHSYSHPNLNKLSKTKVKKELQKTASVVKDVTGNEPTLFRPPYGLYNKNVTNYCKVPMIYWTVDFEDWNNRSKKYVYKQILKQADDGEIILLHDIHKTTVKGFKKALPKLRKKGFELVTVSELYKIKNVKLVNSKMHYSPRNDKK